VEAIPEGVAIDGTVEGRGEVSKGFLERFGHFAAAEFVKRVWIRHCGQGYPFMYKYVVQ
jgi:hypothetical protein